MEQIAVGRGALLVPRTNKKKRSERFRRGIFAILAIVCFFGGVCSLGLTPLVTYLAEVGRQKLASQKVVLSYGEVIPNGLGVTLRRVTLNVPSYQISEQFDSISIAVHLTQLLRFRPTVTVSALGLGGTITADIDTPFDDAPALTRLALDRISLRSSSTLAAIGLANGFVSGSLSLHRELTAECDSLSPPCYRVSLSATQIEKTQPSELSIPGALREQLPLSSLLRDSKLSLPTIPRTNLSASVKMNNGRTIINSATIRTTGIAIRGSAAIPAGTGGTSTIGWYEDVQAFGSVELEKTLAGLVNSFLPASSVTGSIAPDTETTFMVAGPLLSPKLTLKRAESTRFNSPGAKPKEAAEKLP